MRKDLRRLILEDGHFYLEYDKEHGEAPTPVPMHDVVLRHNELIAQIALLQAEAGD